MPARDMHIQSITRLLLIIFCSWLFIMPAWAAGNFSIDARSTKKGETITINVPVSGKISTLSLDDPPRLVVDIPTFQGKKLLVLPKKYKGAITRVRVGQYNPETLRIVMELNAPIKDFTSQVKGSQISLNFSVNKNVENNTHAAVEKTDKEEEVEEQKPISKKEKKSAKKEKSEDVRPLIVIDAGHGGQDPGARGENGAYEKNIVLTIAKALKQGLIATKRYRAILTRENDTFILLRQRSAIARKADGDLFISIHADSAPGLNARGLSVYSLSETASDKETEMLAASENKADALSGMDLSHESADVAGILISLAQRETNNTSAFFADLLVQQLNRNGIVLLENPHRFAGFAVLKAPDMPSVLIETGFISNPVEEKQLQNKKYREQLVKGIVSGIDSFFQKKEEGGL